MFFDPIRGDVRFQLISFSIFKSRARMNIAIAVSGATVPCGTNHADNDLHTSRGNTVARAPVIVSRTDLTFPRASNEMAHLILDRI